MFEAVVEKYLKEKKVYILIDHGWYYDREIRCFEDAAEAIATWEKVARTSFTKYQEYLDFANCNGEGHWYYTLETIPLWDIFQQELAIQKEQTIREEAEQIRARGDKMIQVAVRREVEKEFAHALDGAIHYLTKTVGYSPAMWSEERKRAFEEMSKNLT